MTTRIDAPFAAATSATEGLDPDLAEAGWLRSKKGRVWQKIDIGTSDVTVTVFKDRFDQWSVSYFGRGGRHEYVNGIADSEADACQAALGEWLNWIYEIWD